MADSSYADTNMASAMTVLSAAASLAAAAMVVRSMIYDILPPEFQEYLSYAIRSLFKHFSSEVTIIIDEFDGLVNNQVYEAAKIYLGNKISPKAHRFKVSKSDKEHNFKTTVDKNEEITDVFDGAKFKWFLVCQKVESKNFYNPSDINSTLRSEVRWFQLSFHRKHKDMVLKSYLPYIVKEAKSIEQETKTLKIFTVNDDVMYRSLSDVWECTNLDHPATFETLAMDSEIKNFILKDLERFVKRKEYYRKVGKAWKRGYLLYGPPGTGKSSLIAAMANYLNFDIYDLELTALSNNSELRRVLISMANRSILVVEDIDCTIKFKDRRAKEPKPSSKDSQKRQVTLSGLLNFIDGLWSSCGDERIIVFTTNHKEKLDPALLRPGRMDVHVLMSYCTPCGFRTLAANYLGIKDHALFEEIEESIGGAQVTPAEVAEVLMRNDDPDVVLRQLIEFFEAKRKESEEAQANRSGTDQEDPETQDPLAIESDEDKEVDSDEEEEVDSDEEEAVDDDEEEEQ